MAIELTWDNPEHTILIYRYTERSFTWDEVYTALEQTEQMIADTPHPVGLVVMLAANLELPKNALAVGRTTMRQLKNLSCHTLVVVGMNTLYQTFTELASRLLPGVLPDAKYVRTLDEARALLQQHYPQTGSKAT